MNIRKKICHIRKNGKPCPGDCKSDIDNIHLFWETCKWGNKYRCGWGN